MVYAEPVSCPLSRVLEASVSLQVADSNALGVGVFRLPSAGSSLASSTGIVAGGTKNVGLELTPDLIVEIDGGLNRFDDPPPALLNVSTYLYNRNKSKINIKFESSVSLLDGYTHRTTLP